MKNNKTSPMPAENKKRITLASEASAEMEEYKGIMIASVGDEYGNYSASGKKKGDVKATDMDVYLGEYIAYQAKDGKWGYVDADGKVQIKAKYDEAKSFSTGLGAVCKDGKWGYINEDNTLVIDYQFTDVSYFSDEGSTLVSNSEGNYHVLKLRFN